MFGDGFEERWSAYLLEERLRADPRVTQGRNDYNRRVGLARKTALAMSKDDVIEALCKRTPAYIVPLLETEDDRFGKGSLAERYARTFWKDFA